MSDSLGGSEFPPTVNVPLEKIVTDDTQIRYDATAVLSELYTGPLIAYLRRKRKANLEDAREVVQDFFTEKVLIGRVINRFDANYKGKRRRFRNFICFIVDRMFLDRTPRMNRERALESSFEIVDKAADDFETNDFDNREFEYILAANLLFQIFTEVKRDCFNKNQEDIWRVFSFRRIEPALTREKPKRHREIAGILNLPGDGERRSRNLQISGDTKFRIIARRKISDANVNESEEISSLDDILRILANPPIVDLDLCEFMEELLAGSPDENEAFRLNTVELVKQSVEGWLSDDEAEEFNQQDESWNSLLNTPLNHYVAQTATPSATSVSFSMVLSQGSKTLGDGLFTPTQRSNALEQIRQASRNLSKDSETDHEQAMHIAVYCLVHANDIVFHKECFSKLGSDRTCDNLNATLEQTWIDEESKWLLQEAIKTIKSNAVCFKRG